MKNKERYDQLHGLDILLNAATNNCLYHDVYKNGKWVEELPAERLELAIKQFKEIHDKISWLIKDCEEELQAPNICLYVMNEERFYNAVMRVVREYPPELHEEHMNENLPAFIDGMKKNKRAIRLIVEQAREELNEE